jgi:hypothetical protein
MQNQTQIRVPVLNVDGQPIMPTKASRARRWLRDGKAKVVHNDLGVFQIQLLEEASGTEQQDIVVGIDQGKLFTGMAVQSSKSTLLMLHLELPFLIVKKRMEQRKLMRKARRKRRIKRTTIFKLRNHRQHRFNNRKLNEVLPPSIKANKELERRIILELSKIFPITNFVFEILKAKGSKGFSEVMCGQNIQLSWLKALLPTEIIEGWKTSILRDKLGLVKNKLDKSVQEPATHAIDGVALACHHFIKYIEDKVNQCADWFGEVTVTKSQFVVVGRPKYSRRQLHLFQYSKGGETRRTYGGSRVSEVFRKGDKVFYRNKIKSVIGYCSGLTAKSLSISDVNWSRIGRFSVLKCQVLSRSCGLTTKIINPS